jgi:hypothetical protein
MLRRRLPNISAARQLREYLGDGRTGAPERLYRRAFPLRPVTIRLEDDLIRALKRIALQRQVPYQALARAWLRERAIQELRPPDTPRR